MKQVNDAAPAPGYGAMSQTNDLCLPPHKPTIDQPMHCGEKKSVCLLPAMSRVIATPATASIRSMP